MRSTVVTIDDIVRGHRLAWDGHFRRWVASFLRAMPTAGRDEVLRHAEACWTADVETARKRAERDRQAAERERARIGAILRSEAGFADPVMAAYLALETDLSADTAVRVLEEIRPAGPDWRNPEYA